MALKNCEKCGKLISNISNQCPFCNAEINIGQKEQSFEEKTWGCVTKPLLIFTILAIILIIIVIIGTLISK